MQLKISFCCSKYSAQKFHIIQIWAPAYISITVDWPRNSQIIVLTVLDQVSILDFRLEVGMCNFGITIFRMGNLLHFSISLFYFFMLFPWIPRTLIDGLILSSNTSVENWKWFIRHTSWLSSDLIPKEIYDCETKKGVGRKAFLFFSFTCADSKK